MQLKDYERSVYEQMIAQGIPEQDAYEAVISFIQAVFSHFTLLVASYVELDIINSLIQKEKDGEITIEDKWNELNRIVLEEAEVDMEDFRKRFWEKISEIVDKSTKLKEILEKKVASGVSNEELNSFIEESIEKYLAEEISKENN